MGGHVKKYGIKDRMQEDSKLRIIHLVLKSQLNVKFAATIKN